MTLPRAPRALAWGLLLGTASYLYWYGTSALDPRHIDWLSRGDPATSFLAWHFFRFERWAFPLGVVHGYGEGMGTTLVVTDALPLVAIPLKLVSGWLPERFQYFGWWALACFVLNAATAYALLARLTANEAARIAAAAFVATAPFVIWRGTWHLSLLAQWEILLALILYLGPATRRTWIAWAALLAASGLTMAYLFVIVGAVWVAAIAHALWIAEPRTAPREATAVAATTIAACAAAFWLAGAFSSAGHAGIGGYGYNQLDLLAFFDSRGAARLHPGFAKGLASGIEDFQYLGLGPALAVACAAILWALRPARLPRRFVPLVVVALALFAFAVTHRVTLAGRVLWEVPLPGILLDVAAVFRSSARMGWLAAYLLLAWALVTIASRLPRPASATLLLALAVLGVVDASSDRPNRLALVRHQAPAAVVQQREFAAAIAQDHRRLVWVPKIHVWTDNVHEVWGYGVGAAPRGLAMNVAYTARYDSALFMIGQRQLIETALRGPLDPASVYVTRNPALAASLLELAGGGAAQGRVGADAVILPRARPGAPVAGFEAGGPPAAPQAAFDAEFKSSTEGRFYLAGGWSQPHEWGTWSDGDEASLVVPAPAALASGAPGVLKVFGHVYSHRGPQAVEVVVNGRVVARWRIEPREAEWLEAPLPPGIAAAGGRALHVTFRFGDPQRPIDAPQVKYHDRRRLGFALVRLRIE